MREWAEPIAVERADLRSTIDLVRERARLAPRHVAFRIGDKAGGYRDVTLPEFLAQVDRIACALRDRGIKPGDCCCILGSTSYDWALTEWGIWRAGGVVVPIYETSPLSVVREIMQQTEARILFADSDAANLPDGNDMPIVKFEDSWIDTFGVTSSEGRERARELDAIEIQRDDVATIVYTSGTTGDPQGTVILHRNFVDLVLNVQAAWRGVLKESGSTVIFLPLAHVLARGLQMMCLWAGMRITYLADPSSVVAALPELKPTFLVIVPRVAQKIRDAVRARAVSKHLGGVWKAAEKTAIEWGRVQERRDAGKLNISQEPSRLGDRYAGVGAQITLRARHAVFNALFYSKVKAMLGGEIEFMLSGAAPLDAELSLLFRGMGLPVMEGYGLTETTAPMAGNRPGDIRSGSVGRLVPGTSVIISDAGEILVKGVGVAPRYINEQQTRLAFEEGWFHTGDLGEISDDGYLTVTGRVKDVIVTAGGKTISPAKWESLVEHSPCVDHAVMIGDNKPYVAAILIVNKEELAAQIEHNHGKDSDYGKAASAECGASDEFEEITEREVLAYLQKIVDVANAEVSHAESVKKIRAVVLGSRMEHTLFTPTLKLKRHEAVQYFRPLICGIYEGC